MKSRVRTSVVVVHLGRVLTFKAKDPTSGKEYFFLPGGKIEEDETAPEAAERETFEETGFQVQVEPSLNTDREYIFNWNGEDYNCLTIFYWAKLKSAIQSTVRDADYNHGVQWIPLAEVSSVFGYHPDILSAIQEILERGGEK